MNVIILVENGHLKIKEEFLMNVKVVKEKVLFKEKKYNL